MNYFLPFLLFIIGDEIICVNSDAQNCRMYKVGTLVEKKLQDIVKECPHQYCIAAHCFKDDGRYLTYYSCHRSDDPTLCAQEVGLWLSIEFCQDKTGSTKEQCEANYNGDTKSFELKYGGYKCNPCTISGKWEGNKDFPEYLPTTKATTKESKNGGEQKLEIFVPFNISGIGNDCADIVHSSFTIVIGIALLAIILTGECLARMALSC